MGILFDLLKDVPLSPILRERIAILELKIVDLEAKVTILTAENAALKEENRNLKMKLSDSQIENDKLRAIIKDYQDRLQHFPEIARTDYDPFKY